MESLGVSERNSYEWSSPIWGQQYPCQNIFHPPPPTCVSINSTTVKKKEEEEEEPKKEVILHDCEAEGKGKKRGKRPKKPSKKNLKRNPRNPRRNIHILPGCGGLNPRVQKKNLLNHFVLWLREKQRVNLFLS